MEQTLTEFLTTMGFESHPFNATNADDEPRLNEYFVEPLYFASVYGDPADPKSCIVFAPRGAGKSAQRRMVEMRAPESEVLCVTYDEFRNPRGARLTEMTLDDHLQNLSRIFAVGLLTWMAENPEGARALDKDEKRALRALAHALLSTATRADLNEALQALRNLSNKTKKVWNDNNWVLNAVLSVANIAAGGSGGVLNASLPRR